MTDSPVLDSAGNFWFAEAGAGLLTRISGVSEGSAQPAALPVITAATGDGSLTAQGLREIDSVDVEVVRKGAVVARAAGVPVGTGGGFQIGGGGKAWDSAPANPLVGGDTVRVVPHGRFPKAAIEFGVAALDASVASSGTVDGHAMRNGSPLSEHVVVEAGAARADAAISDTDGTFQAQLQDATAGGVVVWSTASPSAVFRTRTSFPGLPGAPTQVPPSQPGPAQAQPGPTPAGQPQLPPSNHGSPAHKPPATPTARCKAQWLARVDGRPRVVLLGRTRAALTSCLGQPTRATRGQLRFGGGLLVRFAGGVSQSIELTGGGIRGVAGVGVGSRVSSLRRELGGLRSAGRNVLRVLLQDSGANAADVRVQVRNGRATRITATSGPVVTLDAAARRLMRGMP
jgi:hypothetical protein